MSRWFQEIFELGDCSYFLYDGGPLGYALTIADELVILELYDGQGFVPATVISDDEQVLAWAEKTFERFKRESESLGSDAFAT